MFNYLKKAIKKLKAKYDINSIQRKADRAYELALKNVQGAMGDFAKDCLIVSDLYYENAVGAIKDADKAAKIGNLEESISLLDIAEKNISFGRDLVDDNSSFSKLARKLK